jgi:alkaline phosphatase D
MPHVNGRLSRRELLEMAAALGAAPVLGPSASMSAVAWRERRDLFPEGVASGDPDATSAIVWTRRPWSDGRTESQLTVEVSGDQLFRRIVASATAAVFAESDWTCRKIFLS